MSKRLLSAGMALCICLLLCGCDSWMNGHYSNVTPHRQENAEESNRVSEVRTYAELRQKLEELVESGRESTLIYMSGGTQSQLESYMEIACSYVENHNAIGAYAVDEITYDVGTSSAKPAAAVTVKYLHGQSEILRMDKVKTMSEAAALVSSALDNCDPNVVVRVEQYRALDFTKFVQAYVDEHPQRCMEAPGISAEVYPKSGDERVIRISFTYQTDRESLRDMQIAVQQIFSSAKLYVNENALSWEKCSQLYSFLMERYAYKIESSVTPSYSLLYQGVGDSKAFATVYAAMCRQVGLTCQVVSGTKDGQPWYWNTLLINDVYYHVDLLRCRSNDSFFTMTENQMDGYEWNETDLLNRFAD